MAKKKTRSGAKKTARRRGAKASRRSGARRPAKKAARKTSAAPTIEALARKIVRVTSLPSFPLGELYAESCRSEEGTGNVSHGIAGLEEKLKRWEQMQSGASWKPRNVWTGRNTVCIEWDADVQMRDGRKVSLREIAVHELRNGKIVSERFYYNPLVFGPPPAGS